MENIQQKILLPKKGNEIELTIDSLAFGGRGVAKTGDFVWFVDRAIPGQTVKARVSKKKKNYGEAYTVEVLTPSPDQVEPRCRYFGVCGGCQHQHYAYEKQVDQKTRQVKDLLKHIGGLDLDIVRPALGADPVYGYRNKMEFTFGSLRWRTPDTPPGQPDQPGLGLHVPRRFDKILDIEECPIQSEKANGILKSIHDFFEASGLPPYDQKTHLGFWRFCILREGMATGELMAHIVTSGQYGDEGDTLIDKLAGELKTAHSGLTTFVHSISDNIGQVARGETARVLFGPGTIREKIGERIFEIAPEAFFQTNTIQTNTLFKAIEDAAKLKGDELLFDLYCGTGAIGIFLADKVKTVIGVEVIEAAVESANRNKEINQLDNVTFIAGDMKDAISKCGLEENHGTPDVVVIDPPRGGTHPDTIEELMALKAKRLVYVSCNPPHLAKDLKQLTEIYEIESIQPVDMFPHTKHIEVVTGLVLKESN